MILSNVRGGTLAFLCFVMIHSGDAQERAQNEAGSVKLNVVDVYGGAISHAKIEMRSKFSGEDFSQRFSHYRAINIPYGEYLLRVSVPGFIGWSKEINVERPENFFTIALEVAPPEGERYTSLLVGDIQPAPEVDSWVRLVAVYSRTSLETEISKHGYFYFEGTSPGTYLLLVVQGDRLIHTETVKLLTYKNKISINLSKSRN